MCVGQNYRAHGKEMGRAELERPLLFGKFASTAIGDGDAIVLPQDTTHVDAEAELAVVIGKPVRRVSRERALDAVEGYVVANDLSARDIQYGDGQWFRGKNFETFCVLGEDVVPVSELGDGSGLRVVQRLNGDVMQDGSTDELIFDVSYLVAFASSVFTLEPGDVILTGTPAGVGWARDPKVTLQHGDVVEVEVERVGRLRNPVCNEVA